MSKYKEIQKLHEMLSEAGIEHEWVNRNPEGYPKQLTTSCLIDFGWQIVVYRPNKIPTTNNRLVSIIEGYGTYGVERDLLEIMGLLTPEEEEKYGGVRGYLTAEDVFKRIERAVNGSK